MLDLKLINAAVSTMCADVPTAGAVGILSGRIVGFEAEVADLPARRTLDCRGAVVLPGFGDAHNHMAWFGQSLAELDLSGCTTVEEVYDAVATFSVGLAADAWVIGSGYDNTIIGSHPHRKRLDAAAEGRPVWLKHRSGHACTVNSEVLARAGVLDGTAETPVGGEVVRDADGPTGVLQEQAQKLVTQLVVPYPVDVLADAITAASSRYASEGLTHVTEAGIGAGWIGRSPVELAAYTLARERGGLKTRVQLMISSDALHPVESHPEDRISFGLDLGLRTGFGDDALRLGPMKIFVDGSLIGRTAAVTEPFCGGGHNTGGLQLSLEELTNRIVAAHCSGWTVAAHAIGDRAIDIALDAFEAAHTACPRNGVRHRIEHAGIVRPDQIARFRALGVTPVPQLRFLHEMGSTMLETVGEDREALVYRHRSFLEAGVRVPGSSDRPVAAGAPLLGMQSMVQRRTADGRVMSPGEGVDAETALRAYTVDAAWIAGDEDVRGTLEPGKLADLVLLSDHPAAVPADAIGRIEVLATFVEGLCVHGDDYLSSLEV